MSENGNCSSNMEEVYRLIESGQLTRENLDSFRHLFGRKPNVAKKPVESVVLVDIDEEPKLSQLLWNVKNDNPSKSPSFESDGLDKDGRSSSVQNYQSHSGKTKRQFVSSDRSPTATKQECATSDDGSSDVDEDAEEDVGEDVEENGPRNVTESDRSSIASKQEDGTSDDEISDFDEDVEDESPLNVTAADRSITYSEQEGEISYDENSDYDEDVEERRMHYEPGRSFSGKTLPKESLVMFAATHKPLNSVLDQEEEEAEYSDEENMDYSDGSEFDQKDVANSTTSRPRSRKRGRESSGDDDDVDNSEVSDMEVDEENVLQQLENDTSSVKGDDEELSEEIKKGREQRRKQKELDNAVELQYKLLCLQEERTKKYVKEVVKEVISKVRAEDPQFFFPDEFLTKFENYCESRLKNNGVPYDDSLVFDIYNVQKRVIEMKDFRRILLGLSRLPIDDYDDYLRNEQKVFTNYLKLIEDEEEFEAEDVVDLMASLKARGERFIEKKNLEKKDVYRKSLIHIYKRCMYYRQIPRNREEAKMNPIVSDLVDYFKFPEMVAACVAYHMDETKVPTAEERDEESQFLAELVITLKIYRKYGTPITKFY